MKTHTHIFYKDNLPALETYIDEYIAACIFEHYSTSFAACYNPRTKELIFTVCLTFKKKLL